MDINWTRKKMDKTEILQLIGDIESDSKKKSSMAEQKLIKICEPVIKKYHGIASEYGAPSTVGWDCEYMSSRGGISSFDYFKDGVLHFSYTDGCMGEIIEALVNMPLEWIDESNEDKYRQFCKSKNICLLESEIRDYEKRIELRKNKIKELEGK